MQKAVNIVNGQKVIENKTEYGKSEFKTIGFSFGYNE